MLSVTSEEGRILSQGGVLVELGEKEYTLYPKRGRARTRKFREFVGPLVDEVKGLGGLLEKQFTEGEHELTSQDWNSISEIAKRLLGSDMDILLDLVYEWEPSIAKDRGFLEGTHDSEGEAIPPELQGETGATDTEFIQALFVILKFIYGPFVNQFLTVGKLLKTQTPQSGI